MHFSPKVIWRADSLARLFNQCMFLGERGAETYAVSQERIQVWLRGLDRSGLMAGRHQQRVVAYDSVV